VQEAVDSEGELVPHAHHDRVGLVPVAAFQVSERPAVGGFDHHRVRFFLLMTIGRATFWFSFAQAIPRQIIL